MGKREKKVSFDEALAAIRAAALELPGAWEDHPWGENAFKAGNKKIFVSSSLRDDGILRFGCKLPHSGEAALTMFSFCAPMGYGLGKSGWVTATFNPGDAVPLALLLEWLAESYAAVAPKKQQGAAPTKGAKKSAKTRR